jgi:hypothetical protein
MLMLSNNGSSGILTAPTAGAYRQLHLNLTEAARTLINGPTDLAIGDSVTDTNVHGARLPFAAFSRR